MGNWGKQTVSRVSELKNMAAAYDLEGEILQSVYLTVFAYDRKATLFVTVCGSVGIADNHLVKCVKILRNGHNEPHPDHHTQCKQNKWRLIPI